MSQQQRPSADIVALIIDDRASSLEAKMELLQASGFQVIGAKTINEAVMQFQQRPVDIVVTDVNLNPDEPHDKSGIEFARQVRALQPKIPIVGYSAAFSEADLSSEELRAFDRYWPKGVGGPLDVLRHVTHWIALTNSYRTFRQTRSLDHLDLLHVDDQRLYLYSVGTWLAYNIAQRFYRGYHYVWCTPDYDSDSKPSYAATVPPSSCPKEIYLMLREAVRLGDRHSDKIKSNAAGIVRGAELRQAAGHITPAQCEDIKEIVNHARIADFRPLLYIIRRDLVQEMLVEVPVAQKAAPLAQEFVIERLPWYLFEVRAIY